VLSRRSFTFGGLAAVTAGCRKKKSPGFDGYAYVANEAGNAIAVVDLTAFVVARHIPLDDSPTAVIADPARPRVYALAQRSGTIYEIDTEKFVVLRHVKLGPSLSMRMSGDSLWVLGKRSLTRIPIESFRRGTTVSVPVDAHDFDVSTETRLASVSYGPAGSLSVVDLEARSAGAPVKISDAIGITRFRPDGKGILVGDMAERRLWVLDKTARVIVNLPLAVRPDNLCFNNDGGQLFITGEGRDAVVVIFPYYIPQVAETVLAGHAPAAMAASATHLFLANPKAGDVTVLDIDRRKIVAVTAVGADPGFITVTPDNNYALVLNRQSGDMAVIRTKSIVAEREVKKTVALFTMIPVGSRPVSCAVKSV
jgi:DNA-binding beta-propeller fold protein YncE